MLPHAYLVVGGSEPLTDLGPQFRPEMVSGVALYQPQRAMLGK